MRRVHILDLVVVGILLLGIGLRLNILDIPFDPEDVHLDYLAAHHIVRYGEIPWSGSGNPILIDSPLYYYIVSLFVRMSDTLLFLAIANIVVIQGATFALMYGTAAVLFNRRVGALAVLFAALSYEYMAQGAYFFQTHVMQVFANGAFLFLALYHMRKQFAYAIASVILLGTALTIHHSILATMPLFLAFLFMSIPAKERRGVTMKLLTILFVTLVVFQFPIGMLLSHDSSLFGRLADSFSGGFVRSVPEFIAKFGRNTLQFVYEFSFRWREEAPFVNGILGIVLGGSLFLFVRKSRKNAIRRYIWAIIALIFQLVFIASLLRAGVWNFTFSAVFGLYLILVSAAVVRWFDGTVWEKVIGGTVAVFVLYVFSNGFMYLTSPQYPRLYRWNIAEESRAAIVREVRRIHDAERRNDYSFFRIQRVHKEPEGGLYVDVYSGNRIQIIEDILYWPALEREFATRFVRMELDGTFPTILNRDEYVFVICDSTRAPFRGSEECVGKYLLDYPEYQFVGHVYEKAPISIELIRRDTVALTLIQR